MTLPDLGSDLFGIVLRTTIVYAFLLVVLRLTGKREVGQFTIFELIVVLIISDAVQNSMVGENTTIWGGLVAVGTLLVLDIVLGMATGRSRGLRRVLEGEPRMLVRDGEVLPKALREERIDLGDVLAAVRRNGLARISDVGMAVLETDGSISVVPKSAIGPGDTPTLTP
jgi:uncharacterized membrane protein YcaP (DUF421 family)